jgi:hypothetical protein
VDPGGEPAVAGEIVEGPKRRKEGLLDRISGILFVPEKTAGNEEKAAALLSYQLLERLSIPSPEPGDEPLLFVG